MNEQTSGSANRGLSSVVGAVIILTIVVTLGALIGYFVYGAQVPFSQTGSVSITEQSNGDVSIVVTSMGDADVIRVETVGGATYTLNNTDDSLEIASVDRLQVFATRGDDEVLLRDWSPSTQLQYDAPVDCTAVLSGTEGDGSAADPHILTNAEELQCMSDDTAAHYELGHDITAWVTEYWNGGDGFAPVGSSSDPFEGSFDGAGYTIDSLTIDRGSEDTVGLFGYADGDISNVELSNPSITGNNNVGTLVGTYTGDEITDIEVTNADVSGDTRVAGVVGAAGSGATLTDIYSSGTVGGDNWAAGIVGESAAELTDVESSTSVTAYNYKAGGVAAWQKNDVTRATASGDVTVPDTATHAGGLVGALDSGATIHESHATGDVTGPERVGGLVGLLNNGTITNSYATGTVDVADERGGGLVGYSEDTMVIEESYAAGDVNGGDYVGGLVGYATGTVQIDDTYALGSVTGADTVGGLVGTMDGDLSNSYALGDVTGDSNVGGVVSTITGDATDVYWDAEAGIDEVDEDSGEGTPLNTSEIQGDSAESNMALDFTTTWETVEGPDGYPALQSDTRTD